jgi:acetyltransferase-like isoleucine patch superfamily enzyme
MNNIISHSFDISLKTKIGKNSSIMKNCEIDAFSIIGNYNYIGNNCFITKANIGNYCSIANNVSIGPGEHNLSKISTNSIFYNEEYEALTKLNCTIKNDVWIGVDSVILRGVTIGNGVIIGANSVVNKDIPDFAIAVGSPAKVIKYRFKKNKINKILKSKWWESDIDYARKLMKDL